MEKPSSEPMIKVAAVRAAIANQAELGCMDVFQFEAVHDSRSCSSISGAPSLPIADMDGRRINPFVPDPIPFIDDLLLLIATVALGAWRKPRPENTTEPS